MSRINYNYHENNGMNFCDMAINIEDLNGKDDGSCNTCIDMMFLQGGCYHIEFVGAIEFNHFYESLKKFVDDVGHYYKGHEELSE